MHILIVTQRLDTQDRNLGFFHGWVEEFSKHVEGVTVLCQSVGTYVLPSHVTVVSLRKESLAPRWRQILRFWKLLWTFRHDYDVVFVHMIPWWVILGAPLWRMLHNKVYLWHEHRVPSRIFPLAVRWSTAIFSATSHGVPPHTARHMVVGHGIDTDVFTPQSPSVRDPYHLITVGRVSTSKHIEVFLDALTRLDSSYQLTIVGEPRTDTDRRYSLRLKDAVSGNPRVTWSAVEHALLPSLLNKASLFLHASTTGLDKALLEAMACGCLVVSCSPVAPTVLPEVCCATPNTFSLTLQMILSLPVEQQDHIRMELRRLVCTSHSLPACIGRMVLIMEKDLR